MLQLKRNGNDTAVAGIDLASAESGGGGTGVVTVFWNGY